MKYFLLLIIKIYWILIPKSKRRKCLFKISCSNHVYKKTKCEGLFSGLNALKQRVENCNKHYNIIEIDNKKILVTSKQLIYKEEELNPFIVK